MRSGLDFSGQINAVETESEDVDGESEIAGFVYPEIKLHDKVIVHVFSKS